MKCAEKSWNQAKFDEYANEGCYCLALAYKKISTGSISLHEILKAGRDTFEKELNFLGIIVYSNVLRKGMK